MQKYSGQCRCGNVQFEVAIPKPAIREIKIDTADTAITVDESNFKLLKGVDMLSFSQGKAFDAKHYFCRNCNVFPFYRKAALSDEIGVNLQCLNEAALTEAKPCCIADIG